MQEKKKLPQRQLFKGQRVTQTWIDWSVKTRTEVGEGKATDRPLEGAVRLCKGTLAIPSRINANEIQ